MRVSVTTEHRFVRTPDQKVWTQGGFGSDFWTRYLDVFAQVNVIARIEDVDSPPEGWTSPMQERVTFSALPYYIGPWQYLPKIREIRRTFQSVIAPTDALILRVPSPLAVHPYKAFQEEQRPYGVEVRGDPYDVFGVGGVRSRFRLIFRELFTRQMKAICRFAASSGYVTQRTLQKRYPPNPNSFSTYYSSIILNDESFVKEPKVVAPETTRFTLVTIGSLEQLYKAPDIFIDAVVQCRQQGLDLCVHYVGDGRNRSMLEERVRERGLTEHFLFLGKFPAGDAVRAQLDQGDLFVLPSRTEGLPRAMVEAMARGLPCIGSTVGGIPELLEESERFPSNDVDALAQKIREVLSTPARLNALAARNLEFSRSFHQDILRQRRNQMYRHLLERTEHWLESRSILSYSS